MKRITVSLSALFIFSVLFTLTSCNKEEASNGTQFRASMEDCTSQNGKTTLSGTALNWVSGDLIAVYGTVGCGIYSSTPQDPATTAIFNNVSGETGDPTFRAFYPTTLTTDGVNVTLPAMQTYVENSIHEFPMYAESSNNTLSFKNLCGALKLHLTANVNISSIAVTAANEINGIFSVDYNAGDPQLAHVSGGSNTTTLTCTTPQSIVGGKYFYIYLPEGRYTGLRIELNTDDGLHCVKTANTTIMVTRSQYTLITLGPSNLQFPPIGSKGSLFTINADGDQVWFSQGNLSYQPSTHLWRFPDNQYDMIGSNNVNISSSYSWVDLFGWGTGNNPMQWNFTNVDYPSFVDWGSNAIVNGGNQANVWFTLSSSEWDYLLNSRANATNKRGSGSVNGIAGIILLPDSWTMPQSCSFNPGFNGWESNMYNLSQWESMELAGAVFLPAAANRVGSGTSFGSGELYAQYWTASSDEVNGGAYFVNFHTGISSTIQSQTRGYGFSVRLVHSKE